MRELASLLANIFVLNNCKNRILLQFLLNNKIRLELDNILLKTHLKDRDQYIT